MTGAFYRQYVHLPRIETPIEIEDNPKLFPYFQNCLGALDGCHIDARVPEGDMARYRNRKGRISQNVLAVCGFDMRYVYVLSGWEGSASDSLIYEDARQTDFRIPDGWFYLADAGFPLTPDTMVPYRGKRYHLKEWGRSNQRPRDKEELFNLRHAQARNTVERIFGVDKRRFRVLTSSPEYSPRIQAMLVSSVAALHNFISIHDPDDLVDDDNDSDEEEQGENGGGDDEDLGDIRVGSATLQQRQQASALRDSIAQNMWVDYQAELARRGLAVQQ